MYNNLQKDRWRDKWAAEASNTRRFSRATNTQKLIMLTSVNVHLFKKVVIWTVWESKRCDGQKRNQWISALVSNWPTDHPSGESLTGKLVGWTLAPRLNCALFQLCNGLILALQPNSRPKTCPLLPIRKSHVTQAMDALHWLWGTKATLNLVTWILRARRKSVWKEKQNREVKKSKVYWSSTKSKKWKMRDNCTCWILK